MRTHREDHPRDWAETRRLLGRLAPVAEPYKRRLVVGALLVVVYALTILAGPYLLKIAIDRGIARHDGRVLDFVVVAYVIVTVISWRVEGLQIKAMALVGEGFLRDLRSRVFAQLLRLSMPFYDRASSGVVVSRMTSDIDVMENLVQQGLILIVTNVVLLGVAIVVLAVVSWQLLLLCLVPLPAVAFATIKFNRDSNRSYLLIRDWIGLTLTSLQEGISGVRVIQAFDRSGVEVKRFSRHNRGLYDEYMHSVLISCWYLPIIEFSGLITTALIITVGGVLTVHGTVTIGTITFFVLSLSNLFDPVQQLSQYVNQVQQAGAGLSKLADLLDEPVDVPDPDVPVPAPDVGEIVVSGLWFGYGNPTALAPDATVDRPSDETDPARFVLRDVDLVIGEGEHLALVGPTGAGKSTLAKLVARFYDPTAGSVTFGGIDLRAMSGSSLRTRICVVPQEGFLFSGTILENVRLVRPDASEAEVIAAFDRLGIRGRFESLPDGFATEVHERGSRLSAGEKQLVSLARAALADPAVLVLDEATSSLDPGTESVVESALERLMADRTVIMIAHRLSTAERADRVGVVADGVLAELGTHAELVAAGGRYGELHRVWTEGLATRRPV
ncbi:MAG: ABC transporter ATP-binding protein [Actinobacteria bacterium]|nr:ABC transporter ATP-binding protein [Actinomycetota bacterium]